MTIESFQPVEKKGRGRKDNPIVNETTPLLLSRHDEANLHVVNGTSFTGTLFNLSTTIIGAGIMALPASMKVLSLIPGIAMIVVVAFLTEISIEMLLRFSRAGKLFTYGGVVRDANGKIGRVLLQICVVVNTLGVMIVYMIIIGDVLSGSTSSGIHHPGVLEGWFGDRWWNGRFIVLLLTTIVVFAPLASFKRLDSLRYTSALAVALTIVFVAITTGIAIVKLLNGSLPMPRLFPEVTDLSSVWNPFTVVHVLVTTYICHFHGCQP